MKITLKSMCYRYSLSLIISLMFAAGVAGDDSKPEPPNYNEHIKPILRQHCLKCHGDDKQEADLNLQGFGSLLRGGSGGKIVEAGRPAQSLLYKAITNQDPEARMPPNSPPLPKEKIEVIRNWIDTGLRESSESKSLTKSRDLTFVPAANIGAKPNGSPAMPIELASVQIPQSQRPLPVLALNASPWAPLLAVSGSEHIRLINTSTEEELGRLAFPEGEPHVIRFSGDGSVLMVAGGRPVESGRVVLFDVRSGKRLAEVGDEIDEVLAADLSADQRLIALGGSGRVVKVYATTDGVARYKLTKHTDWITAVAFSPDGSKLATADRAGGIHLWDAENGGILLNLAEHKAAVRALAWRADSKMLASTGEDGSIVWWDIADGFPVINKPNAHPPQRPTGVYGTIPNGVLSACFDHAGNLVTSGRDCVVKYWDSAGSAKKSFPVKVGIPISVAVSHDGGKIIAGDSAGEVHFWKTE